MIIISLTTIPPRIDKICNKLYDFYNTQTIKPDKIILNICKDYKRFGKLDFDFDNDNYYNKINCLIINYKFYF